MVDFVITENEAGQRLDRFLRKYMKKAPLSMIYKTIRKDVKINGKRGHEDTILQEGDRLALYIPEDKLKEMTRVETRKRVRRQFRIAYEDDNLLIVEKPAGLLTHGDSREKKNTLANQVCGYLQEKGEFDPAREKSFVPSPVNRLDRNTTGLVIFGKNAETLRSFTKYIRERQYVSKYYVTLVKGFLKENLVLQDRIEKDHGRNISQVTENTADGKSAETFVRPSAVKNGFSVVEVELVTGRTHQIRVHLSHEGYPLVGDMKYGDRKVNGMAKNRLGLTTQLLHAYQLRFDGMEGSCAYLNGKTVKAGLPQEFRGVLEKLGFTSKDLEAFA